MRRGLNLKLIWAILTVLALNVHLFSQGSENVPLLANINQYPHIGYNDCWGYTAPDGREYALLGVQNGTSIIDITDIYDIKEVAFIPSELSLWKDIKTYQHYAYAVNETGGGLQIIDLSGLPGTAVLLDAYDGFVDMHNIYIDVDNAMLYASPGNSEAPCIAINLENPVNPAEVSRFGVHNHDAHARDNVVYLFEGNHGTTGIYDLSIPGEPLLLQKFAIPSSGYVHSGWLSDDGSYLMTAEETGGKTLKMWDIRDLNNTTLLGEYLGPSGLAHNPHIKGNYAYISHYADGLRIIDISDPENLREVGYFDTFSAPSNTFDGAWGAFPFFVSGKVVISDMTTGLYVVFFEGAVEDPARRPDIPARPAVFDLSVNYPNPFNGSTHINYHLRASAHIKLEIYANSGQKVLTLLDETKEPGFYHAVWDGRNERGTKVSSGVYFYRLSAGSFSKTRRMLLVK